MRQKASKNQSQKSSRPCDKRIRVSQRQATKQIQTADVTIIPCVGSIRLGHTGAQERAVDRKKSNPLTLLVPPPFFLPLTPHLKPPQKSNRPPPSPTHRLPPPEILRARDPTLRVYKLVGFTTRLIPPAQGSTHGAAGGPSSASKSQTGFYSLSI